MIALILAAKDVEPRRFLWPSLVIVGLLLLLALIVAWVDRWRKRQPTQQLSTGDQLSQFRALFEKGELSKEEYTRIHSLLAERFKREIDALGPASPEATPPAPSKGSAPALEEGQPTISEEVPGTSTPGEGTDAKPT